MTARMTGATPPVPITWFRRSAGVVRVIAAAVTLAALLTQIVDQWLNDAFVPTEYFSYFTIQTSLLDVVVLASGGVLALRHPSDGARFTAVRAAIVTYAVVTATVYAVLLRGIPQEGFIGVPWPNEVIHVVIPAVLVLDWLVAPGRSPIGWSALWLVVSFPLAWVAITLVRGGITGWFPYPFLQPDGAGGWGSVAAYIVGIAVFVVGVGCVAIALTRPRRRFRGEA